MNEANFIKANKIQLEIKRINNAIKYFKESSPPSRVAVATSFRHSNPMLHELDLSEELNNKIKRVIIDMLRKEIEDLSIEFNEL